MLTKILATVKSYISFFAILLLGNKGRYMRRFELQLSPIYWWWRERKGRLKLYVGTRTYRFYIWLRSVKENIQIGRRIVHSVILPTLFAFLIIGFLFLFRFWTIPQILMPTWFLSLGSSRSIASSPAIFDANTYVSLLSTLAQIAGVFLGLYFTAISLVLSTSYARVPANVRRLLMREKISNFYTYMTAVLVAIPLLLLGLHSYGVQMNIGLTYLVLLLLSMTTIFGFVFLGLRAFHFFNPVALVDLLLPELRQAIRSATPGSLGSQDPAFQDYFRRQATASVDSLESVMSVAITQRDIHGDDVALSGSKVLTLLQFYVTHKARIPTQSKWFEQKYEPRDWLTSDSVSISMALSTNTPLSPKEVPDMFWLEKRLIKLVICTLEALREKNDAYNAAIVLNAVQIILRSLGENYAVQEALLLHRSVGEIVWNWIEAIDPEEEQQSLFKIPSIVNSKNANSDSAPFALIDFHGLGLVNIILGLSSCLPNFDPGQIESFLKKVNWRKRDTLYRNSNPQEVWRELESLQENIEFEISIEGYAVSPAWLQQQTMARGLSCFLRTSLFDIVQEVEEFAHKSVRLLNEKHYFAAAVISQRGLEVCDKIHTHLDSFQKCNTRFESLNHQFEEPWPKIDWDDLHDRTKKSRAEIVDTFSQLIIPFLSQKRPVALPDYFGHAYSLLVHEIYSAIVNGDEIAFKKYFPILLVATWGAHDRVLNEYLGVPNPQYVFAHRTEPIVNALALSGLALIYSELDGREFWQTVKECWDAEMKKRPKPQELCQLIGYSTKDRFMKGYGAWTSLRNSWKQVLVNLLREQGFLGRYYNPGTGELTPAPQHSSEFIKFLTNHGSDMLFSEPEDVFIAYYLTKCPEAKDVRWSRQVDSLLAEWQELNNADNPKIHGEE